MKIAHVCLSCFYIDGRSYQENDLVRAHVAAGHDVLVLASTETMAEDGRLIYVDPAEYDGGDGARVIRIPYRRLLPQKIMRKLRIHPGVYDALKRFQPDSILFHGTCGWEVRTVARYVRNHPGTLFYVDSHEDSHNSGRGFLSRELLHKRYYGPILRCALPQIRKILCLSTEVVDFVHRTYRIPRDRLEFFPLGGHLPPDAEYHERRARTRAHLGLGPGQIMLLQAGKQTAGKRLLESLAALAGTNDPDLRLFVAGSISADIRPRAGRAMKADPRVTFLGWQSREQLTDLLCAADVYLQPGTQSVTMQQSLCCRCAVIIDDVPAHKAYQCENGWFVSGQAELEAAFAALGSADLPAMQKNSENFAREFLDYAVLAGRVLR